VNRFLTRKNTHLSLPAKRFAEFVVGLTEAFQALQEEQVEKEGQ
jgi:hypothetical protein